MPTYQRPAEVMRLIELLAQLPDAPAEVVVVDGSPDSRCGRQLHAWRQKRELPFDLVYVESPRGLPRQRNVGIDISRGEYVFFLDDDCLPQPGYFERLRAVLADDDSGELGAACGTLINEMARPVSWRWRVRLALGLVGRVEPGMFHPCGTSVPRNLIPPFYGVRPTDTMPGGASVFRRDVLLQERFSEYFQGYAQGEDLEMSLRVRRRWRLLWCGDAHAIHDHAPGGRPTSFAKGKMEFVNRYFIWSRYAADADWTDRSRFWLDAVFVNTLDVAVFALRPWRVYRLAHGLGVCCGALYCLVSPPRYQEPKAQRRYALQECEEASCP